MRGTKDLRTVMENLDNAERESRSPVASLSCYYLFRRLVISSSYVTAVYVFHAHTYALYTRMRPRAFHVSRTRASVTPVHPSLVIYRTRYRSLIAYCNTRSYP